MVNREKVLKKIWIWVSGPPLPACRSSPTPLPFPAMNARAMGVGVCVRACHQCAQCVRARALQNRTTVLFYGIERPCFFIRGGPDHFRVLFVNAVNALHCVCLYVHWRQRLRGFVYLRGFQAGLVNRNATLDRCNLCLFCPLYICTQMLRVWGFFLRVTLRLE